MNSCHRLSPRKPRRRTSGVTLVEMLIVVTLTLLVMAAVTRVFELMGTGIRRGRATIEMAGRLRSAAHRLQQDLDGLTVPTLPWVDPDHDLGYLEIIEGAGSDHDPEADLIPNADFTSRDPSSRQLIPNGVPDRIDDQDASFGDIDDILMCTVRSTGKPFVGRISQARFEIHPTDPSRLLVVPAPNAAPILIESNVAEVIWWIGFQDSNGNRTRDPGEFLTLHRRQLLVRPDLDFSAYSVSTPDELVLFFNQHDVSASPTVLASGQRIMVANSLGDLSRRENRFMHENDAIVNSSSWRPAFRFPYPLNRDWLLSLIQAQSLNQRTIEYKGEDVILPDILAFDIRVYDTQARIRGFTDQSGQGVLTAGIAVTPGDAGFRNANFPPVAPAAPGTGVGAYVDLNYARYSPPALIGRTSFSHQPSLKSQMWRFHAEANRLGFARQFAAYDTWPSHYERDGLNQDEGFIEQTEQFSQLDSIEAYYARHLDVNGNPLADEGTNGIDDPWSRGGRNEAIAGVDDETERETSPPYPFPLRGVEITLRMMEFSTRQVRQVSVVGDFVPE